MPPLPAASTDETCIPLSFTKTSTGGPHAVNALLSVDVPVLWRVRQAG
ncbi:hypothetical protein AtDm6_0294 [Acetobacter tropicalis]|uniref:Uncharacterized protein n=2 Tax=Acetobacter tropicalis TaxID=104102 RepID=F7VGI3_9PROT|nr:hypothetical protein AtDm6_0294 [Acetobacter tropicalis]GAA09478.1 hypothetical protein ATPR_2482 [Acetobacter tropicalis NBRC 101654]